MEGAKGKQEFGRTASSAIQAFGRTATHVFRMVMLEACGVDPQNWPSGGKHILSTYYHANKFIG